MNSKGQDTKQRLADSLKTLMQQRSFEKITIQNITDAAGFIRPTFYNHFQDKYQVVEWIFEQEVINSARSYFAAGKYKEGIRGMLEEMQANQSFYVNAAKISGQNAFRDVIFQSFRILIEEVLCSRMQHRTDLPHLFQPELLAEFYANAETFLLMKWLDNDMSFHVDDMEKAHWFLISVSFEDVVKEISLPVIK